MTRAAKRLSPEQLDALRNEARVELARDSLIDFVRLTSAHAVGGYKAGWVHRDLCRRLERFSEAVRQGKSPRLIVNLPPQHGKSWIVTQRFPIWHMARNPGHNFICASYGDELANDHSRAARDVASSPETVKVFPGIVADPDAAKKHADVDRVNNWQLANGSRYVAVGRGGSVTGRPATVFSIDDLLKNQIEADSPTILRQCIEFYQSTARTRVAPGGGVLVTSTRWDEGDLTGWLKAEAKAGGEVFEVVEYPAIAEEDERYRKRGEALHPERYDLDELHAQRRTLGARKFSALYQQAPTPGTGYVFQRPWFGKVYREDPQRMQMDEWLVSIDCAFEKNDDTDFIAMQAWGRRDMDGSNARKWGHTGGYYILDQVHDRMSYTETREAARRFCVKWRQAYRKIVEGKANGPAIIDDLRTVIPGLIPYKPTESKLARARLASVAWEAGNVWVPSEDHAPWIGDFVEQHLSFTGAPGRKDDQVDASDQALLHYLAAEQADPLERTKRQFGFLGQLA